MRAGDASHEERVARRTPDALPDPVDARPARTTGQAAATAIRAFPHAARPYPMAMSGLRVRRSPSLPARSLVTAARPSATPSTTPTTAAGAPSVTVRKIGRIG